MRASFKSVFIVFTVLLVLATAFFYFYIFSVQTGRQPEDSTSVTPAKGEGAMPEEGKLSGELDSSKESPAALQQALQPINYMLP